VARRHSFPAAVVAENSDGSHRKWSPFPATRAYSCREQRLISATIVVVTGDTLSLFRPVTIVANVDEAL